VDADLLILLSDVKGLYTGNPQIDPEAKLIKVVEKIDNGIEQMAGGAGSSHGTGGMVTKIEAARLATSSGVAVIIADGREQDIIVKAASGKSAGTIFLPRETRIESRQRWLLSGLSSSGRLTVDKGAALALLKKKRSLLPAGIADVEGTFDRGDVVDIYDPEGNRIASGVANYCSADLLQIRGLKSGEITEALGYEYGDEAVHRNNLVLI
jgi:glutamate 5-kinase